MKAFMYLLALVASSTAMAQAKDSSGRPMYPTVLELVQEGPDNIGPAAPPDSIEQPCTKTEIRFDIEGSLTVSHCGEFPYHLGFALGRDLSKIRSLIENLPALDKLTIVRANLPVCAHRGFQEQYVNHFYAYNKAGKKIEVARLHGCETSTPANARDEADYLVNVIIDALNKYGDDTDSPIPQ